MGVEVHKHHHTLKTPKATDALVYTEDVVICKTDEDLPQRMPREQWVNVDVITVAAPDLRDKANQYVPLVGCGAFRNDPEVVARAFKVAIGEFPKVFKKIEFAVYCSPADQKNYETFSRVLG